MTPIRPLLLIVLASASWGGCSGPADAPGPDAAGADAAVPDAVAPDAPAPDAAVDADPASPRPILRYDLDGDTANRGSLGPAHAGVASSTGWVAGRRGQAIEFTGSTASRLVLPGTANLLATTPQLTIGLWVRETALPAGPIVHYLIDNRCCGGSTDRGFQTYHGRDGAPLTTCSAGGCATISYQPGAWRHLSYRYDATAGARLELFVDGTPAGVIANPGAVPILGPGLDDLQLGFNTRAQLDDVVIYDRVFTDEEQCALVVGGAWTGTACQLP